jgi:protein-disulfide isomerase
MNDLMAPVGPGDHVRGTPNARVTLVEYGDFECPQCGRAQLVVQEVERRAGEDMRFVFRHFPLSARHRHAATAAEAAEVAAAQGCFWPMHDMLFEHQDALELGDIVNYAEAVGLDMKRFAHDLEAHALVLRVERDLDSGAISGVRTTPTFFLDGERLEGAWDADALTDAVRSAATRAKAA